MIKNLSFYIVILAVLLITNSSNCGGDDPKINYELGFFPDSVVNIDGMNSQYDDYNMALPQITMNLPIIFSSNRFSSGSEFDLVTGHVEFIFNQIDGSFILNSEMIETPFYEYLENTSNTDNNELGPYRMFNGLDGSEYFFYATDDAVGNLELMYMKYFPTGGAQVPSMATPAAVSVLNSGSDDAYITFDWDIEKAYFTSNRDGSFNIYETPVSESIPFSEWLEEPMAAAVQTDSINSTSNDKCPFILDTLMVFASDRAGGLGGYDLYISKMKNGKWGSPKNMGPDYNTEYNEYRPLMSFAAGFTNNFMLFSSDRPGGKGGYDLYFTGFDDL